MKIALLGLFALTFCGGITTASTNIVANQKGVGENDNYAPSCAQHPSENTLQESKRAAGVDKFNVIKYSVTVKPSLSDKQITGREKITFQLENASTRQVTFSANDLEITSALLDGDPVDLIRTNDEFIVGLPETAQLGQFFNLDIEFSGTPSRGVTFDDGQLYTGYFSCDWMICRQEPFGDKAEVTLEIILPKKTRTIGPGQLIKSEKINNSEYRVTWQEKRPYSPYLFAFAVGDFTVVKQKTDKVELRYISTVATSEELTMLFSPTAQMLAFFEEKAGAEFPHPIYSQLYVEGGVAQEALSHSNIGQQTLAPIIENPQEDWVIAHELAHQWWGNSITSANLSDFWLNEGVTVFMVAAWKEHRWGRDAYDREISLIEKWFGRAKKENFDKPLSFDKPYPSLSIRRSIQYAKGALFMHALRNKLGDDAFWAGLKDYTQQNMGKSVTSEDFQCALEQSTGRDLGEIFKHWVY